MPLMFDWTMIIILPPFLLALWAQNKVRVNYSKYSQVASRRGYTGAQVAAELLRLNGINDVKITRSQGELSDHYNPGNKTVGLSAGVHDSISLSALSIAAHEVGHAIQHAKGYGPLTMRSAIIPLANIGSGAGIWMFMIGMILPMFMGMHSPFADALMIAGMLFFCGAVAFQLVTLPVEFNASSRAMEMLQTHGFLDKNEVAPAKKVLDAAALTYVAAAATALAQLIRLLVIFSRSRERR